MELKIMNSQDVLDLMEESYNDYNITEQEIECLMELEEIEQLTAFLLTEGIYHNITVLKDSENSYIVKLYYNTEI